MENAKRESKLMPPGSKKRTRGYPRKQVRRMKNNHPVDDLQVLSRQEIPKKATKKYMKWLEKYTNWHISQFVTGKNTC